MKEPPQVGDRVVTPRGPGVVDEICPTWGNVIVKLDQAVMSKFLTGVKRTLHKPRRTFFTAFHHSVLKPELPHET